MEKELGVACLLNFCYVYCHCSQNYGSWLLISLVLFLISIDLGLSSEKNKLLFRWLHSPKTFLEQNETKKLYLHNYTIENKTGMDRFQDCCKA
jgi:hypothetical protein